MSCKRTAPSLNSDKAIKFIGHFLSWYQESFSQSEAYNNLKLVELVKEAEDIHTQRIKEIEVNLISKVKNKPKRKRISKYL